MNRRSPEPNGISPDDGQTYMMCPKGFVDSNVIFADGNVVFADENVSYVGSDRYGRVVGNHDDSHDD